MAQKTTSSTGTSKKTPRSDGLPFDVGDNILIRTVTQYQLGKVLGISADAFILGDASWVADTGRFHKALASGELNEVEFCAVPWMFVSRGAVVDIVPWGHPLPKESK